jgi:diguanylate cyclase
LKRSKEEYILLTLCVAGILGITPILILRLLRQQWLFGIVDTIVAVGIVLVGLHVWRTREVRLPAIVLTIIYMSGMVAVVYISDASLIYWAFPTTTATYFLLKPKEAALVNAVVILSLLPVIIINMGYIESSSILTALVLNNIFSFIFARNMQLQLGELALLATRDSLTGAGNRRLFNEKITESIALTKRNKVTSSLIMLDIDHFKKVNDEFGHVRGDEVLVSLVDLLRHRLRESDGIYRLGGEEFAIVSHNVDSDIAALAEELRLLVEKSDMLPETMVTISLGVANSRETDSDKTWVERADAALYQAKNSGRNKTCAEN